MQVCEKHPGVKSPDHIWSLPGLMQLHLWDFLRIC